MTKEENIVQNSLQCFLLRKYKSRRLFCCSSYNTGCGLNVVASYIFACFYWTAYHTRKREYNRGIMNRTKIWHKSQTNLILIYWLNTNFDWFCQRDRINGSVYKLSNDFFSAT